MKCENKNNSKIKKEKISKDFSDIVQNKRFLHYSDINEYGHIDEDFFYDVYNKKIKEFVFLVGFPKCATTTLSNLLSSHREIVPPLRKEPPFFSSDEFDYGMGYYWKKYHSNYQGEKVVFNGDTASSFLPFVGKRIAEKIPKAKIIFSLRNPIDRAYSNWRMYYVSGMENLSFREAVEWEMYELEKNLIPLNSEDSDFWKWYRRRLLTRDSFIRGRTVRTYLLRGFYYLHIKRFLKYFNKKQLYFVFKKELESDPERVLVSLLNFIGVDPQEMEKSVEQTKNFHVSFKSKPLQAIARRANLLFGRSVYNPAWRIMSKIAHGIDSFFPKSKIDPALRKKLDSFYKDKNKRLEKLLDINLSRWNK